VFGMYPRHRQHTVAAWLPTHNRLKKNIYLYSSNIARMLFNTLANMFSLTNVYNKQ